MFELGFSFLVHDFLFLMVLLQAQHWQNAAARLFAENEAIKKDLECVK